MLIIIGWFVASNIYRMDVLLMFFCEDKKSQKIGPFVQMVAWTGQSSSWLSCNFPLLQDSIWSIMFCIDQRIAPVLHFIRCSCNGGPHNDWARKIFCPRYKVDTHGVKKKTIFNTVHSCSNSSPANVDIKANWKLWIKMWCKCVYATSRIFNVTSRFQERALPYLERTDNISGRRKTHPGYTKR
jgi:hypothetical protein